MQFSLKQASAAVIIFGITFTSAADAGNKQIDWDKKLVKVRQLIDTNNVEEAMKLLREQLRKHPEAGPLHTELGRSLKIRGKMGAAKDEFKRSTEVEPGYADAWYELGAMEEVDKEYKSAIDAYERYLQTNPSSDRKDSVLNRINFCKSKL